MDTLILKMLRQDHYNIESEDASQFFFVLYANYFVSLSLTVTRDVIHIQGVTAQRCIGIM